jgi:NAD-dependent dihydropyrimidine dehydrogenase PreA subunit
MKYIIPTINLERCDRCGKCVDLCPEDALRMTDQGPVFNHPITCTYCSICEDVCPQSAIRAPLKVQWSAENAQG